MPRTAASMINQENLLRVCIHVRLLNRYTKPASLMPLVVLSILALKFTGAYYAIPVNPGISVVVINFLVYGFLFEDLFLGETNMKIFYFLYPIDLKKFTFARNFAGLLLMLVSVSVSVSLATIILHLTLEQISDAFLYFFVTFFGLLHFWNFTSIMFSRNSSSSKVFLFSALEILEILGASIPYFIMKLLSTGFFLCSSVIVVLGASWYVFSVPQTSRMLLRRKFDIIGRA